MAKSPYYSESEGQLHSNNVGQPKECFKVNDPRAYNAS